MAGAILSKSPECFFVGFFPHFRHLSYKRNACNQRKAFKKVIYRGILLGQDSEWQLGMGSRKKDIETRIKLRSMAHEALAQTEIGNLQDHFYLYC